MFVVCGCARDPGGRRVQVCRVGAVFACEPRGARRRGAFETVLDVVDAADELGGVGVRRDRFDPFPHAGRDEPVAPGGAVGAGGRRIGGMRLWSCRPVAVALCVAACAGLTACTPDGKAVGDTQEQDAPVAFDGLDRGDVLIGYIGSDDSDADALVLQAFDDAGLDAIYLSTAEVADPAQAAQNGVRDMAFQQASIVMIADIDVTDETLQDWDDALTEARTAGIPVVMVDPVNAPADETLFAASFVIDAQAEGATAIDDAVMTVIDDKPHERTMTVTTAVDES